MTNSNHEARIYTGKAIKLIGGMLGVGVAVIVPGTAVLLEELSKHMDKKSASRTLSYMKYRKLVEVNDLPSGEIEYRLTEKGFKRHKTAMLEDISISTPLKWDSKWRVIIFDVPSDPASNYKRRQFTDRLKELGFYMLQRSTWIHPFECSEEIGVLLDSLELDKYVSLLLVENGNFVDHATEHFKKAGLLR